MGDQIVALEHETDGVVSVRVPVPVGVFLRGNTVDDQITAIVAVQTADDIEQRGLTGAAGAQNSHEFIVPQIQAHAVQRRLDQLAGDIGFSDILNLKHKIPSSQNSCICNKFTMKRPIIQGNGQKCCNKLTKRPCPPFHSRH